MHIFNVRGLGAVGDAPLSNDPDLRAGYEWFPYMPGGVMTRMCPSDSTRKQIAPADALYIGGAPGCWIKNSRAWGQRVEPREFSTSTPPATPTTSRSYPPDPSGDKYKAQCQPLWDQGMQDPALRACVGDAEGYAVFYQLCAGVAVGYWSFESAAAEWAAYASRRCTGQPPSTGAPPPAVPPPQPPGAPVPPPEPPPSIIDEPPTFVDDPGVPGGGDLPVDGGGLPGDFGSEPGGEEPTKKGLLRQVGPIVGIGLLAAIGLTLARSKKLKLTRRRKRR